MTEDTESGSNSGITVPSWFLTILGAFAFVLTILVVPYMTKTSGNLDSVLLGQATMTEQLKSIPEMKKSIEIIAADQKESDRAFAAGLAGIERRVYALELSKENQELKGKSGEAETKLRKQSYELDAKQKELQTVRSQIASCRTPSYVAAKGSSDSPLVVTAEFFKDLFGIDDKPVRRINTGVTRVARN